ncbi:hypothetical protein ACQKFU_27340 [Bacillus mycoides]|uniref:hypothetical protein n=1 Tax=Bacillus mycoides TaxID=1405 RepID=UPI003D02D412
MGNSKDFCPYCNADLQGEPIPKQSQKTYGVILQEKLGLVALKLIKSLNGNIHIVGNIVK